MSGIDVVEVLLARIDELAATERSPVPWFLDVDGVLNVIGERPAHGWPDYERTVVTVLQDRVWPICFAPGLVSVLNVMAEKKIIQVRWLTTWEHAGPARFAPGVGLRLGSWIAGEDVRAELEWWKLRVIREHMNDDDGQFIWTDDDIKEYRSAQQLTDFLPPQRAIVICPDERFGLTPQHIEHILDHLV